VQSVADLVNVVLPLFDNFTLRSTKLLDYTDFKTMVLLLQSLPTAVLSDANLTLALKTIAGMNSNRTSYDYSLLPVTPINAH